MRDSKSFKRMMTGGVLLPLLAAAVLMAAVLAYDTLPVRSKKSASARANTPTTMTDRADDRTRNGTAEEYRGDTRFPGVASAVVGRSVEGRAVTVYRFNRGTKKVLFVAGTHGDEFGVEVAEGFIEYLRNNPHVIPGDVEIYVLPNLNPDGWEKVQRGNARNVDLNRNLPAEWSAAIDPEDSSGASGCTAGPKPASEPETRALMALLEKRFHRVVSLHSLGGIIDYDGGEEELAIAMARASSAEYYVDRTDYSGNSSGSLGTYASSVYQIPVITIELESDALDRILPALLLAVTD
ncbi:MAG: M14 family zinc carboxypeptidase [Candidatus Aquicultorales bacterium]